MISANRAAAAGAVREWGTWTGVTSFPANVTAIAAGSNHTLGLTPGGFIVGWGDNFAGELNPPFELQSGGVVAIAAGLQKSYALTSDGTLTSWGSGFFMGFGWTDLASIAARDGTLVGVTGSGTVLVEGGTNPPVGLSGVSRVAVGEGFFLALKTDGTVAAWGLNYYGRTDVPANLNGVIAIAAGAFHSLALKSDGTVVAWGAVGLQDKGQAMVPAGLSGVTAIAAGNYHSLALKSDGTVVAWGDNRSGQSTPPAGMGQVQAIAANGFRSLAIVTPAPDIRVFAGYIRQLDGMRRDFGVVNPGSTVTRTFAISNYGTGDLTGLSVSIDGVNASRFSVSPLVLTTLPPGAHLDITVTFAPDTAAPFFAALHVTSNDPDESVIDFNLTGRTHLSAVGWPERGPGPGTMPPGMADLKEIAGGSSYTSALRGDGSIVTWGGDPERGYYTQAIQDPASPIQTMARSGGDDGILLKADGSVWLWDLFNFGGQLLAPGSTVQRVAAGGSHFLAMRNDGSLIGWLGWSATNVGQANIPADLGGLVAFCAGFEHTAVVTSEGSVLAWGRNTNGQTDVPADLRGVVDVAAGHNFTLALKGDGTVTGWGANDYGQLNIPANLSGVVAIFAEDLSAAALKSDGSVIAWGLGGAPMPAALGRAGAVTFEGRRPMALVTPMPEMRVTAGSAALSDGSSADFSWTTIGSPLTKTFTISNQGSVSLTGLSLGKSGANPGDYTLGSLTTTSLAPGASTSFSVTFSPAAIGARLAMLNIASNDPDENPYHIALVGRTPMAVAGWGWGASGQTEQPPGLGDAVALAAGYTHSLALRSDGTVVAWGNNSYGQTDVPAGLVGVKAIAAGWYHSLALKTDGTVVGWGMTGYPQLQPPTGLTGVKAIAAGAWHSLALKNDGTVTAWGLNFKGQIDISPTLSGVTQIAGGYDHSLLALGTVGEVSARVGGVGSNQYGQIELRLIEPLSIFAGDYHNIALLPDGTVQEWGRPLFPQVPRPPGLHGVTAITAGIGCSGALKNDGTVAMWGSNAFVLSLPSGLGAIGGLAFGGTHTLALVSPSPDIAVNDGINRFSDGDTADFNITGSSGSDVRTFTLLNHGTQTLSGLLISKSGTNAANFTIGNLLVTALAPGATTTFTVTFQTTTGGTKSAALHIASNDPNESPFDLTLTGTTGLSPIELWRQFWFGSTVNGNNAWDEADPDRDSLLNFMEFAFGTDPTHADRSALSYTGPMSGGGTLVATGQPIILHQMIDGTRVVRGLFVRRKDSAASGVTYNPQISGDLASWTTIEAAPAVFASDSTYDLAAVTFPALLNGKPPRFFRVIVRIVP